MVGALEGEGGKTISSGMRLTTLLRGVRRVARTTNIEGVLLGSCTIGANRADLLSTLKTTPIAWIFGYACEIDWIPSTLIDLSILEHAMALKKEDLRSRTKIVGAFSSALSRFSGEFPICKEETRSVPLKYAISLLGKPRKPHAVPEDLTRTLLGSLGWDTL